MEVEASLESVICTGGKSYEDEASSIRVTEGPG